MNVAVVGAGIVGLSTAVALMDRGVTVTVFERGIPGNGQSGGSSRIFRHAHDDPRLVELAQRSLGIWRTWEQRFGTQLVSSDGGVAVGPAVLRRFEVMTAVDGVAAMLVDGAEVPRFLPMSAGYDGPALVDHTAGAIRTRAAIGSLTELLRDRLITDEVYAVAPRPTGAVDVVAGGSTARFDRAVICAGRHTAQLAGAIGRALPVALEAHIRFEFAVRDGRVPQMACLQDASGQYSDVSAYGTPQPGGRAYAVGLSRPIAVSDDLGVADADAFAQARQETCAYVRQALPGLAPQPVGSRACWITRLPWGDDGLAVWQEGNVHIVAGHNLFKLAPWIGTAVADAVVDGELCDELRPDATLGGAPAPRR
ncbi:MAG: FAD-binding oxidoreductase [Actinobacteria bacterium]|nr:FAD-binding oxidoreductase [Actinomycetota bacterium]